ncbi:MAG: hypothetical protein RL338_849, partial [Chloroflexota bacterium]
SESGGRAGYEASAWVCTGTGVTQPSATQVTLAGGSVATCTITNTYVPPRLTLVKAVVNSGGGTAAATDWTLRAVGVVTISGTTGSAAVTGVAVRPGTYTLSETGGRNGYVASAWSCSGTGVTQTDGTHVTLGESATGVCTITNTYVPPGLTLLKSVINSGGGTALASDWTLVATGPVTVSGASGTLHAVPAGTYSLSEIGGSPDYSGGTWNCTGASMPSTDQVSVTDGASVACTVVNTYRAPRLTLVKQTVRTGGTPAAATLWTLGATGPATISGATGSATVTSAIVPVGTYALSETASTSTLDLTYEPGSWACAGSGTFSSTGSSVTVAVGAVVSCTIVNTYRTPASLTLTTTVSGGSATAGDFVLAATGPTAVTLASGGSAQVRRGTYLLGSSGPAGYAAGEWICTGGTVTGGNQVSISEGSTVSCSTVSTYQTSGGGGGGGFVLPPTTSRLTLYVRVVNAGGGTARASAWTMRATGPATLTGASGSAAATLSPAATGVYLLRRPVGPSGYAQSAWRCSGGTMGDALHVEVTAGASVSCETTMIFLRPYLATGTFVVVNKAARLGATVRYWGSTWARDNGLAGSPGLSVFRGFAATVSSRPSVVGGTWSGSVTASAAPPRTLPPLIAVVVTNQIRKRGTTVSGNIIRIVLVQRSATFGRGKVVAVLAP